MANRTYTTINEATKIIDALFATIKKHLKDGVGVSIQGFGTLEVIKRKARKGIDFKRNVPVEIPESNRVVFRQSKSFEL